MSTFSVNNSVDQANAIFVDFQQYSQKFERQLAKWVKANPPAYTKIKGHENRKRELLKFLSGFDDKFVMLSEIWVKKHTVVGKDPFHLFKEVGFNFNEIMDCFYEDMIKKYAFDFDKAIKLANEEYGDRSGDKK